LYQLNEYSYILNYIVQQKRIWKNQKHPDMKYKKKEKKRRKSKENKEKTQHRQLKT
jgi:hypothetical protein